MARAGGEIEIMPKMVPTPDAPTKVVLRKMLSKHTYRPHATVGNCLRSPFDSFLTNSAMNDTSDIQAVRFFCPRSPSYRLLYEQRHQCGTGSWQFLDTHGFISALDKHLSCPPILLSHCNKHLLVSLRDGES